jgi:hypothetical protein
MSPSLSYYLPTYLRFSLHRVLTVGPTFEVNAQAVANLDVDVDLTVGLNYKIDKAELIFPPSSKKAKAAGGTFNVGDTRTFFPAIPFPSLTSYYYPLQHSNYRLAPP